MKNLKLNYEGFENNLLEVNENDNVLGEGVQYRFRFDNLYGASIIKKYGSYGFEDDLWELAVLQFMRGWEDKSFITYDTPITNDVVGYLNDEEVRDLLKQIQELNEDIIKQHRKQMLLEEIEQLKYEAQRL